MLKLPGNNHLVLAGSIKVRTVGVRGRCGRIAGGQAYSFSNRPLRASFPARLAIAHGVKIDRDCLMALEASGAIDFPSPGVPEDFPGS